MRCYKIKTKNNLEFEVSGTITDKLEFDFYCIHDSSGEDCTNLAEAFGLYEQIAELVISQNT